MVTDVVRRIFTAERKRWWWLERGWWLELLPLLVALVIAAVLPVHGVSVWG
jgi:hypothetical protein